MKFVLLQNKVAIVTGATRGIGKAILYRLAEEGATVIGVYNNSVEAATIDTKRSHRKRVFCYFTSRLSH